MKKRGFSVRVKKNWCKECDICIALCPQGVLGKDDEGKAMIVFPEKCVGCMTCEYHCPDFAILVSENEKKQEEDSQ